MWASGVGRGLALSVLPRTAKLVMLHVISNEKENLRAEVDSRENCLIVRLFGLKERERPRRGCLKTCCCLSASDYTEAVSANR